MAETSQTSAANQRMNTDDDTVYRIHVSLDGGPRSGLPLDDGFSEERSFPDEDDAQDVAEDIRENPMEYYAGELRNYDGTLNVTVDEDTPLACNEAR